MEYLKSNFRYFHSLLEICCIFLISIGIFSFSGYVMPELSSHGKQIPCMLAYELDCKN